MPRILSLLLFSVLLAALGLSEASGQAGIDPGNLQNDILDQVNNGGGIGGGGGLGDGLGGPAIGDNATMDDMRSARGFVGASVLAEDSVIMRRFVGATRSADAALDTNNESTGNGGAATANVENGFEVQRTVPVRSRVVRAFTAPALPARFVAAQVNQRLSRLPGTRRMSNNINVRMQGRTAILSGTARSQSEIKLMMRMLRFEPGVSRVQSQVEIVN